MHNQLPRWRGFNLLSFQSVKSKGDLPLEDLNFINDSGFDFVRLPLNYWLWSEATDRYQISEDFMQRIDSVVNSCFQLNLHLCLSFHRAPGHYIGRETPEPFNLWQDKAAEELLVYYWVFFAQRYQCIPARTLSFNLVNEPALPSARMGRTDHERVIRRTVAAIRAIDPERLIIVDGLRWGRDPLEELLDLALGQSCRGYDPFGLSHYREHPKRNSAIEPGWPGVYEGVVWNRARLNEVYRPWVAAMKRGAGVHCGEFGCFNQTPHRIALAWLNDVLEILIENDIGWALWNLRGPFGVIDSKRADVQYERTAIGELDRSMLELLQRF